MIEILYYLVIVAIIALFCSRKLLILSLKLIGFFVYIYALISIYIHYCAVVDILEYMNSIHEEFCAFDFRLESFPLLTSSWDIRISYSYIYNEYGERLTVIYYYRKTRPITCVK